jgi:LmbE family N-acetylglucosaminyl deacetylase
LVASRAAAEYKRAAMAEAKKVALAIGAHPDDVELSCAGTLALLQEHGWSIVIASLTPGDKGTNRLGADDISKIRRQEAKEAASLIEARFYCLEWRDLAIFYGDMACKRTTALVRAVDPDVVLTHPPRDYLGDHEETSRIVRHACFAASVRNYEVPAFPGIDSPTATRRIPHLYYFDPIEGIDMFGDRAPASVFVNIDGVIDIKERMLAKHESQREWLKAQHGIDDYLDRMRQWARSRGKAADCEYAEAFRQHVAHSFPRDDLLSGVLRELVVLS